MRKYSEEELIEELQRVSKEHCDGDSPRKKDMKKYGKISCSSYRRCFGSWNRSLKESGFKLNHFQNLKDRELIEELKKISKNYCNNNAPKIKDIKKYSKFSWDVYYNRWGSIQNVVEKINLEPERQMIYSEDEIIEEIYKISEENLNSKAPTLNDMQKYSKYSSGLIKKIFDCTWSEKLEELGFNPNSNQHLSNEQLLQHIKNNSKNNKPPKYEEMQEQDELISPVIFQNRFGTWNKAIEKAGYKSRKPAAGLSGEQSYRWQGGSDNIYYGSTWKRNREKIFHRDNGFCRICKDNKNTIDVHHITPVRYWNIEEEHKEMNHLRNLISLCRSCHHRLEGKFKGRNHKEFEKLAKDYLDIEETERKKGIFDY